MGAFYIITILLFRIVQNYYSKKTSNIFPETAGGMITYMTVSFALSTAFTVVWMAVEGKGISFDKVTVAMAVGGGLAIVIANLCSLLALQSGTMVINSVFATAGLIVPCIVGMFLFGEPMSIWQWLGIAVFIGASWLLGTSAKDTYSNFSLKTVLLLIGSFLGNGLIMLCQKALTFLKPDANISVFSLLTFAIPTFFFGVLMLFRGKGSQKESLDRKIYLPTAMLALAVLVINQFATAATGYVSSAVLFSLINGGNTIIAAIIAAICYKEKPTARSVAGLILGLGALMVINVF